MLMNAPENRMRTTAMVMLIVLAAIFLNFVLSVTGLATMRPTRSTLGPTGTMPVIIGTFPVPSCVMGAFAAAGNQRR